MKHELEEHNKQDFILKFLLENKYRFYRHAIGIVSFLLIVVNAKLMKEFEANYDLYSSLALSFVMLSFFYINMYVLIPLFLDKKKYIGYTLNFLLLLLVGFVIIKFYNITFIEPHRIRTRNIQLTLYSQFIFFSVLASPFILMTTAIKLFQRWIHNNNKIRELENKALQSDLKALKNQINPHFLFNMLNNLNVLIKSNPEKASQVTIKLSDFLRHHLYENNRSLILLSSEIKFIEDYLSLEKIRRDQFSFEIKAHKSMTNKVKMPPNIFTVFVENAIKHSIDAEKGSHIKICFEKIDHQLCFDCYNTKPSQIRESNNKGIGLDNVKQRLDLLYPKQYSLTINDQKTEYHINLKLPL